MQINYDEAVERGVKLLDEHGPRDWWVGLNTRRLDLSSVENCVLGQLYGRSANSWYPDGYSLGATVLNRPAAAAADRLGLQAVFGWYSKDELMEYFGFVPEHASRRYDSFRGFVLSLVGNWRHTRRWKQVIKERQAHSHKLAELGTSGLIRLLK